LLTFVLCLFAFRLHEDTATVAITKANTPFKLVVDAGHGGKDNGAVGINGILEKDINLAFSKKLKQLSGEYKIDVVLTRDDDKYMSPQEKVQFAEAQHANAFISMHVNTTEPGKTKAADAGMEVYVSKENQHFDDSKLLGSAVLQSLKNNFEVATYLSESNTGIWVLRANTLPAILVELGYIDDNNNAANLTNDKKVEQMARKILEGIAIYANHSEGEIKELDVKKETAALAADTTVPEKVTSKSIAGNLPDGPLYIVDGKMVSKSDADKINPNDIKSVNVLKGESATAAYGDKGKNGVIEITTKNAVVKPMNDSVLYVLDGKIVKAAEVNKLDPAKILSMNVLKDKTAIDKYGVKAKYGAVEIISVNKKDDTTDKVLPKAEPR